MKEGISVRGGEGEGDCFLCTRGTSVTASGRPLIGTSLSESESESESDSEDDEDSDDSWGAGMGFSGSGSSSELDEDDDEDEDEDAARLFLFLLRFFGAGGLAAAAIVVENKMHTKNKQISVSPRRNSLIQYSDPGVSQLWIFSGDRNSKRFRRVECRILS